MRKPTQCRNTNSQRQTRLSTGMSILSPTVKNKYHTLDVPVPHNVQNSIHNTSPAIIQPVSRDSGRKCLELYISLCYLVQSEQQHPAKAPLSGEKASAPRDQQTT